MPRQQELPVYEVVAKNYGVDHANKIHSDEGASKYGFQGGLVPGVALYAYLTRPVVDTLGLEWVNHGAMKSRFIHPVYDGERVQVKSWIVSTDPMELELELHNKNSSVLCAIGWAGLSSSTSPPDPKTILFDHCRLAISFVPRRSPHFPTMISWVLWISHSG